MFQLAVKVANSVSTVMISGVSGTGMEVLARYIHQHSPRATKPFIAINCAAIPENMLEAMLFGHEKGAFTGAIASSPGKFEQANGGTILLDEVSEMDPGLQSKLLRRTADVSTSGVQIMKFGEYVHTLYVPTSLNLCKIRPLRGTSLFVLDAKLVFKLVDNFFGGQGRHAKIEGHEFTPTESRIVQMMLNQVFHDMQEAWQTVLKVNFEYLSSEVNPSMANIVSPSEVVVVSTFHIELDGGGGELHFVLPYSMIEPIRDVLDAGVQSDIDDTDERWVSALQEDIKAVSVAVNSTICQRHISLREVAQFKAGDVIPIDMAEHLTVTANGVPIYTATLGTRDDKLALRIHGRATLPTVKKQLKIGRT
jgi:flagellar motor switch protein FliM